MANNRKIETYREQKAGFTVHLREQAERNDSQASHDYGRPIGCGLAKRLARGRGNEFASFRIKIRRLAGESDLDP